MTKTHETYPGVDRDRFGGMTPTGNIVRDAWVFELIPESETCAGWDAGRIEQLYDRVTAAWEPYDHLAAAGSRGEALSETAAERPWQRRSFRRHAPIAEGAFASGTGRCRLPPALRARHERIYAAAVRRARELGWDPELGDDD